MAGNNMAAESFQLGRSVTAVNFLAMALAPNKSGFAAQLFSTNAYDKEAKDIWSAVVDGEVHLEDVEAIIADAVSDGEYSEDQAKHILERVLQLSDDKSVEKQSLGEESIHLFHENETTAISIDEISLSKQFSHGSPTNSDRSDKVLEKRPEWRPLAQRRKDRIEAQNRANPSPDEVRLVSTMKANELNNKANHDEQSQMILQNNEVPTAEDIAMVRKISPNKSINNATNLVAPTPSTLPAGMISESKNNKNEDADNDKLRKNKELLKQREKENKLLKEKLKSENEKILILEKAQNENTKALNEKDLIILQNEKEQKILQQKLKEGYNKELNFVIQNQTSILNNDDNDNNNVSLNNKKSTIESIQLQQSDEKEENTIFEQISQPSNCKDNNNNDNVLKNNEAELEENNKHTEPISNTSSNCSSLKQLLESEEGLENWEIKLKEQKDEELSNALENKNDMISSSSSLPSAPSSPSSSPSPSSPSSSSSPRSSSPSSSSSPIENNLFLKSTPSPMLEQWEMKAMEQKSNYPISRDDDVVDDEVCEIKEVERVSNSDDEDGSIDAMVLPPSRPPPQPPRPSPPSVTSAPQQSPHTPEQSPPTVAPTPQQSPPTVAPTPQQSPHTPEQSPRTVTTQSPLTPQQSPPTVAPTPQQSPPTVAPTPQQLPHTPQQPTLPPRSTQLPSPISATKQKSSRIELGGGADSDDLLDELDDNEKAQRKEEETAMATALVLLDRLLHLDTRKGNASDLRSLANKTEANAKKLFGDAAAQLTQASIENDATARNALAETAKSMLAVAHNEDLEALKLYEEADTVDKNFNREVVLLRSDCIRHQQAIDKAISGKSSRVAVLKARRSKLRRREKEVESLRKLKLITDASVHAILESEKMKSKELTVDDDDESDDGEEKEEVCEFTDRLNKNKIECERIQADLDAKIHLLEKDGVGGELAKLDKKINEIDSSLKRFRSLLAFKASHGLLDNDNNQHDIDQKKKNKIASLQG